MRARATSRSPCRSRTAPHPPTRPSRGPSPTSISRRRSPTSPIAPTPRTRLSRSRSRALTWMRGRRSPTARHRSRRGSRSTRRPGVISGTLTYASAGTSTVTVSVSDGTASADQTFAWTVTNVNQPPTLTDVPDRTDPENTLVTIPLAGADLDAGTTLTYSAAPLPAGLTMNAATGVISGTLTYASAGTSTVTVSVSDGTASADQTFAWTVTNVNQPPTLTDVPDRTDPENTPVAIPLAGADLDAGTTLTYSAAPLPAGRDDQPGDRGDQRHADLCERGDLHRDRVGLRRHGVGRPDLRVDRHQRQSAADAHRRARSHRPGAHGHHDPARGRRPGCGHDAHLQCGAAPGRPHGEYGDRPDQRHADVCERGDLHRHRVGLRRHGVRRSDLLVDRHQRQPAANADRRARSHRPGEHPRHDPARGRRPGCGDDAHVQRGAAPGWHHYPPDDRCDQRDPDVCERGDLHRHRIGVRRHRVGRPDLRVDRHQRQSAADAHRRARPHRPGAHARRGLARGRGPGSGDDPDLQRGTAPGGGDDQSGDRCDQRAP